MTPAEPTSLTIEVAGRRIDVIQLPGDRRRRPLVLMHEGLGSAGLWRDFPRRLRAATGRRVVAFSRFGHGRSDLPPTRRTPAFFHEEALDLMPALPVRLDAVEPVLVGHSDGGSIAMIHAGSYPVAALVLLAPHVIVEDVTLEAIRGTRTDYIHGDLRERMDRHHDDPDAAFWGWCGIWLDPTFRQWSLEADAERVAAPTLLIQGSEDPYGTLEQLDRIEALVHGPVQRLVLPGGHSPHLEHSDVVVRAITAFVGRRH